MPYCTSCGNPIPEGQGKSCSMCYGDPYYGRDGYYLRALEEQRREVEYRQQQGVAERDRLEQESALRGADGEEA